MQIITAVSGGYLDRLRWSLPTWKMKPQFRDAPILLFVGPGVSRRHLAFTRTHPGGVEMINWRMPNAQSQREEMLSAFVLGAARHASHDHVVKLDADTYCIDEQDVFSDEHFRLSICAPRWGYTKPGWWHDALEAWAAGREFSPPGDGGPRKARRIISYCCLHQTRFLREAAAAAGDRLPVPSHDTYLWWLADRFSDCTWGTVDAKARGVRHQHSTNKMREDICAQKSRWQHADRLDNIQLEITTACNLRCDNCDRCCGVAPDPGRMTVSQVAMFVDESIHYGKRWSRIDIIGGEPTLHPQLSEICSAISRYREWHPRVNVRLSTNGVGAHVDKALASLPDWVAVRNSDKDAGQATFEAFNIAPCDEGAANALACSIPWRCGLALTRSGYYLCGAGASVARVFGLPVAARGLDALPGVLDAQQQTLCRLCGHSRSTVRRANGQQTSPTWAAALEEYARQKPALPVYGG